GWEVVAVSMGDMMEPRGMEADDLLCSRNARPRKALVGRAQWKINQPPSPKKQRASLEGAFVISFDGRSRTDNRLPLKRCSVKIAEAVW
ncbi:MAG: hypothetical protein AAB177_16200, partial [Nitrospirota bacterium]